MATANANGGQYAIGHGTANTWTVTTGTLSGVAGGAKVTLSKNGSSLVVLELDATQASALKADLTAAGVA